jgi:sugar/nucleoside kinase (ribokinase family)
VFIVFGDAMHDYDHYGVSYKYNKEDPNVPCFVSGNYSLMPGGTLLFTALVGYLKGNDWMRNTAVFSCGPPAALTRIRAFDGDGNYIQRFDFNSLAHLNMIGFFDRLKQSEELIKTADTVVFSDYGYGGAVAQIRDYIYKIIPEDTIVYSSGRDRIEARPNFVVLNEKEFDDPFKNHNPDHSYKLNSAYPNQYILVTKAGEGLEVYGTDTTGDLVLDQAIDAIKVDVKSSIGAGDAFLAGFIHYENPQEAVEFAGEFCSWSRKELHRRLVECGMINPS